jgi:hypothetical protein
MPAGHLVAVVLEPVLGIERVIGHRYRHWYGHR